MVIDLFERETKTFQRRTRMTRWNLGRLHRVRRRRTPFRSGQKYGRVDKLKNRETVAIHDWTALPVSADSITLPTDDIEQRFCIYLGLSVPELFAQLLHYTLPVGPEGWEASGVSNLGSDALTSMIASVKTLVSSANPEVAPTKLVARGEVASMAAMFLKLYRPALEIETSHTFEGWTDALVSRTAPTCSAGWQIHQVATIDVHFQIDDVAVAKDPLLARHAVICVELQTGDEQGDHA